MGNLDVHLRAAQRVPGQPQVPQVSAPAGHLPRVKASASAATSTGPYLQSILERSTSHGSHNSSTTSLLYTPGNTFGETMPMPSSSTGKRPRVNTSSTFLAPYSAVGFPSPPSTYETDHPLPDFSANWGLSTRNVTRSATSTVSAATSSSNVTTTSHNSNAGATLSALGSPNGTSMFTVDSLLPEYDSGLYSLWNSTTSSADIGYEADNNATQHQQQSLYLNPDEELKMDYPQLSEFNQGDLDYLCGPMEAGPSPTTPLGTSGSSMMKADHSVATDRKIGTVVNAQTREPQLDRLLSLPTLDFGIKRDRSSTGEDASGRVGKRPREIYSDVFPVSATANVGNATSARPISSTSSFRSLARSMPMEQKREIVPSLGIFHSGSTLLTASSDTSQPVLVSSAMTAATSTPTPAKVIPTISTSPAKTAAKRPRSRQCEFPGCVNRARSHQKCKKHGGAHQCVFEGCTKNSQSRGLCIAHGGGSRCKKEGCVRAAQSKGLCKSHGGGEFCAVEGCRKKAHLKHLCRTHGGGVRCKFAKCSKWAQRKGYCMAHAKEFEEKRAP